MKSSVRRVHGFETGNRCRGAHKQMKNSVQACSRI
jgi:hypothetical protein